MATIDDVMDKLDDLEEKIEATKWLWKACPSCNPGGVTLPDFEGCTRCENGFIKARTLASENPGA